MRSVEVLDAGLMTTVQDLGRPGFAHLGVARSGAADRPALRLANRLVGNPEARAGLECTLRGPRLRFRTAAAIALTGAPTEARLDGRELTINHAVRVRPNAVLDVGTSTAGLRTYLAISGGLHVESVLGSCASDTLGRLGPAPLRAGDTLALHGPCAPPPAVDAVPVATPTSEAELRVLRGPRDDWFESSAWSTLCSSAYVVAPDSSRAGLRLAGPRLRQCITGELRSEGMLDGAIQVPPSGQPILLLADHPTTGGYPVIGVVSDAGIPVAAQLRPGATVRFRGDPSGRR
jgi:biotin-dependent carboxylase-like uncharacterized protein